MYVGVARLSVAIGQAHSLKEKRMVLRRVKDRVRDRLGIAMNEVGDNDIWQRAELGVAVTSGDRAKALSLLDDVIAVAREALAAGDAQLVGIAKDVTTFDAEVAPVVEIDDRTGAGDKAIASDDWIPDAWKDELE